MKTVRVQEKGATVQVQEQGADANGLDCSNMG